MTTHQQVDDQRPRGCMSFLSIFDRHQILSRKRLSATKSLRAPPRDEDNDHHHYSPVLFPPELKKPDSAPELPDRIAMRTPPGNPSPLPPEPPRRSAPAEVQARSRVPHKEAPATRPGSKLGEAPRLSLDSRATVDARGSLHPRQIRSKPSNQSEKESEAVGDCERQCQSPSVIARLMGLDSWKHPNPDLLRRSASESRVSKDLLLLHYNNFHPRQLQQLQQQKQPNFGISVNNNAAAAAAPGIESNMNDGGGGTTATRRSRPITVPKARPSRQHQRKSFFDSSDSFPAPRQAGEVERRLMRNGADDGGPSRDLDTLKEILEALQLKGLLHPSNQVDQSLPSRKNFVYDRYSSADGSHIIIMKPSKIEPDRSPSVERTPRRTEWRPAGVSRRLSSPSESSSPAASPRRERPAGNRIARSPARVKSPVSSPQGDSSGGGARRKQQPLQVETQRKTNGTTMDPRRTSSPVKSPKPRSRPANQTAAVSRSPRSRKPTAEIGSVEKKVVPVQTEDESSSSVSECSLSASSLSDSEKSKKSGGSGEDVEAERCVVPLRAPSEFSGCELQPSPVSVLDPPFCKDELDLSPVIQRSLDFTDLAEESEDGILRRQHQPECVVVDSDFIYVSEIVSASEEISSDDSDIFSTLEKRQSVEGIDCSPVSKLQRKLVFDTVKEIIDGIHMRRTSPWKAGGGKAQLRDVWVEFERVRVNPEGKGDVCEVIGGVLRKDLAREAAGGGEWRHWPTEMSELVLDMERQVFKDLVRETIQSFTSLEDDYSVL